ncbi:GerAB/ArcD/ProY family transporter [Cytobacillus gottheilii]|uniref:GerAB/ArcD/ProY family transporter n=1 Tax=Cytobacillus gottheilii TaxID=859144 RepID=UPI0008377989|nr:endospore germination permease [Cytobacillus gottheilii]
MNNSGEKISIFEFMLLIVLFEIGTAIVVIRGADARQNAWLAVSIAMVFGFLLFAMYFKSFLWKEGSLYEILIACFGNKLGKVFSSVYTVYFIYLASRGLRDFTEMLVSVVLPQTPIEFSSILFMAVSAYTLYLGFEVFSRTTVIFAPYIFVLLGAVTLFLWVNKSIDLTNLQPILADGIMPILKAVFPDLLTFPFGELIVFTIILPQVVNVKNSFRLILLAIYSSGLIITLTIILNVSVLSESGYLRANFPLLSSAREISIANFLERIDAFVVFIIMLGVFVKVSIFLFCALKGLEAIYEQPYRYFAFPIGMLAAAFSVLIAFSLNEHLKEGLEIVPYYLSIPLQIGLPMLVFSILFYKSKRGEGAEHEKNNKNLQKNRNKGNEASS